MARLASLAATRAQPLRPALRRPLLGVSPRRVALGLSLAATLLALAYVVARETPLFAVEELAVGGAPAEVRREVRQALDDLEGTSLVKVDSSALERRLRELPSVYDAQVDRSFPHTVRVHVSAEQPLAVVGDGNVAWVVSRRGRVIRAFERGAGEPLPRVWSTAAARLAPGREVEDQAALVRLGALAGVPDDFPVRIRSARNGADGLTFILAARTELRLATADDLGAKLAAAQAVLSTLGRAERRELAYLDVSLPQRPVTLSKSQVVSES